MPKSKNVAIGFSICLITLFVALCFMMSTVNPAKKTVANTKAFSDINLKMINVETDSKMNNESFNDEKENDRKNSSKYTGTSPTARNFEHEKPFYRRIFEIINRNLSSQAVSPTLIDTMISHNISSSNIADNRSVKGMRRSVTAVNNPLKRETKSDSVVLKILDYKGQQRIEIKLISENTRSQKTNINQNKSTFSMFIQENDRLPIKIDLPNNSVIKLMPNNTLTINDSCNFFVVANANESLGVFREITEKTSTSGNYLAGRNEINASKSSNLFTKAPIFNAAGNISSVTFNILSTILRHINSSESAKNSIIESNFTGEESEYVSEKSIYNMTEVYPDLDENLSTAYGHVTDSIYGVVDNFNVSEYNLNTISFSKILRINSTESAKNSIIENNFTGKESEYVSEKSIYNVTKVYPDLDENLSAAYGNVTDSVYDVVDNFNVSEYNFNTISFSKILRHINSTESAKNSIIESNFPGEESEYVSEKSIYNVSKVYPDLDENLSAAYGNVTDSVYDVVDNFNVSEYNFNTISFSKILRHINSSESAKNSIIESNFTGEESEYISEKSIYNVTKVYPDLDENLSAAYGNVTDSVHDIVDNFNVSEYNFNTISSNNNNVTGIINNVIEKDTSKLINKLETITREDGDYNLQPNDEVTDIIKTTVTG